jgi:hypothetical protein
MLCGEHQLVIEVAMLVKEKGEVSKRFLSNLVIRDAPTEGLEVLVFASGPYGDLHFGQTCPNFRTCC